MRRTRSGRRRLLVGAAALLFGLAVWGFWVEPAGLRNEDHTLRLPRWPRTCSGLRIALLGDLHIGSPFNGIDKLARIVATTNAATPDIVLLAGDYVISGVAGGEFVPPEAISAFLGGLKPRFGTYAVLGNHDWWLDPDRVRRALEAAGVTVLEDDATPVVAGRCRFWLAGITDFHEGPHDVDGTLSRVPRATPVLVFTHNPDVFPRIPSRVDLTLAAHTHGGQVYVPLLGRPVVPSAYGQRYAIGHVVENGRHLFVTPGLGTSILPVRFLVPPEISVLQLVPAQ